jgi:hypothetical protein
MGLPVRISAVTLACRDIDRMAAFDRQFEWPEAPTSVPEHVLFQCANGVVLGLFPETMYDSQFGGTATGFRGFTISIHCEDAQAVFTAHEQLRGFDDIDLLDDDAARSGWGCGFSFRDPEGNVWDVAFNTDQSSITEAVSATPEAVSADPGRWDDARSERAIRTNTRRGHKSAAWSCRGATSSELLAATKLRGGRPRAWLPAGGWRAASVRRGSLADAAPGCV